MIKHLEKLNTVISWNEAFGNRPDDSKLIDTYIKLSQEELNEYKDAFRKKDRVEMLDAICDMVFVVGFGAVLQGLRFADFYRADIPQPTDSNIESLLSEMVGARDLKKAAVILFKAIETLPMWKMFDIDGAFDRVVKSNYSKAITNLEISLSDLVAETTRIEKQGEYGDVFVEQYTPGVFVLKARRDLRNNVTFDKGKIVKPSSFLSVKSLGGLGEFIEHFDGDEQFKLLQPK